VEIREWLEEEDPEILLADGFDDCLIGVVERAGGSVVAAYDTNKVLAKLMDRDGMDEEAASEFFEFNILGAYMGDRTPVFITPFQEVDDEQSLH